MNAHTQCEHCHGYFEFDSDRLGLIEACPHCQKETVLMTAIPINSSCEPCKDCGARISRRSLICPKCGAIPNQWRTAWIIFCVLFILSVLYAVASGIVVTFLHAIK